MEEDSWTPPLDALVNDMADGLLVVDDSGSVRFANPAAERLLGQTVEFLNGAPFPYPLVDDNSVEVILPSSAQSGGRGELRARRTRWNGAHAWIVSLRDITARGDVDETLHLARLALDHAAEGTAWLQADGSHYYVNEALCQLLGYDREELLRRKVWDINPEFDPDRWQAHWEALKAVGTLSFEASLPVKGGDPVWVEINANFLTCDGRAFNCAYLRDITEQKRREAEIQHRARQQEAVARLGQEALKANDISELQQQATEWVARIFGVDDCKLLALEPEQHHFRMVAGVGWPPGTVGQATVPADASNQASYTLQTGQTIVVSDAATETRFNQAALLEQLGVVSGISTPVAGPDGPWGVLGAHARRPHVFSEDDVDFLRSVANVLSEAIRNAEVAKQLDRHDQLLRMAGEIAGLGGWSVDLVDGRITLSTQACRLHQLPTDVTLTRRKALANYQPASRQRLRRAFVACARDGTPFDEALARAHPQGEIQWVRAIGEAVRDHDGRIVEVHGAVLDITEQKKSAARIQELADQLTNTLESISDAFFTLDQHWRFTYLNSEALRVLEREGEELVGQVVWDQFPDAIDSIFEQEYRRAVREGHPVHFEAHYAPLGKWFEVRAYPLEDGLAVYYSDITERKRADAELNFLALYDPLTSLPNRELLMDRLKQAINNSVLDQSAGAVLFLDLDDFKTLNESLGHQAGDEVLGQVARRLTETLRKVDTVARFGGDEFVIILEDLDPAPTQTARQAETVAQKLLAALADPCTVGEHEREITPSIGIALFTGTSESPEALIQQSEVAMYQAKSSGRNGLRLFNADMQQAVNRRFDLEARLRTALEQGELVPYFQPQVDTCGRITGVESLVRWPTSDRGILSPGEFIPLAEETRLIHPLGDLVLRQVCTQLAEWDRSTQTRHLSAAVNVSPSQFRDPHFVDRVLDIVRESGIAPSRLKLELTENLLLADVEETISRMAALREAGIALSLDDFGTGYSSLYYIKRLPLDELKIDQRFVQDAINSHSDAAIVQTIIVLARSLGLDLIAEGIETPEMRDFLASQGCTGFQGFLFGHPVPIEDLTTLLNTATRQPPE